MNWVDTSGAFPFKRLRRWTGSHTEEFPYGVYYGARWFNRKTYYSFGVFTLGPEAAGLGGDMALDKFEGAKACDERKPGRVPIYGGRWFPGCGRGGVDFP